MKKVKKMLGMTIILASAFTLGACGNKADEVEKSTTKVENQENVNAIVKAIKKQDVRYKLAIDDEMNLYVIDRQFTALTDHAEQIESYGFDRPRQSTSIYAYALKNDLNEEQTQSMLSLIAGGKTDKGDWVMGDGGSEGDIREDFPEGFNDGGQPYKGADVDYATLSNVKVKQATEAEIKKQKDISIYPNGDNYKKITANVTIYLHLPDGTMKSKTFKTDIIPPSGNTKISEDDKNAALHADHMNEPLPTDRFIYLDKP